MYRPRTMHQLQALELSLNKKCRSFQSFLLEMIYIILFCKLHTQTGGETEILLTLRNSRMRKTTSFFFFPSPSAWCEWVSFWKRLLRAVICSQDKRDFTSSVEMMGDRDVCPWAPIVLVWSRLWRKCGSFYSFCSKTLSHILSCMWRRELTSSLTAEGILVP